MKPQSGSLPCMSSNYRLQVWICFLFVRFLVPPTYILVQSHFFCPYAAAAMIEPASPPSFHNISTTGALAMAGSYFRSESAFLTESLAVSFLPEKQSIHVRFLVQAKSNKHIRIVGGGQSCTVNTLIRKDCLGIHPRTFSLRGIQSS